MRDVDARRDEDAADDATFHVDADWDGYGDPATSTLACARASQARPDAVSPWLATYPARREVNDPPAPDQPSGPRRRRYLHSTIEDELYHPATTPVTASKAMPSPRTSWVPVPQPS